MSKRKFKNGDIVRLNRDYNGYTKGTSGVVTNYNGSYYSEYSIRFNDNEHTIRIKSSYLDIAAHTKDFFLKEIENHKNAIKSFQSKIVTLQEKIAYMEETKCEEFDENEFKAYHTLSIIEKGDLSKIEKAKKIAELIK